MSLTNVMKLMNKSYDDSCSRPNEIMKTQALRKSKFYINTGSFRHHNNRWQCGKKTNCLLHCQVLNLKNFSINPAMMGSQEQTMTNSR